MKKILNNKICVLLAGSFPPPAGGVASINEVIYHGFDDKPYSIILLDSSILKRHMHIKSSSGIINLIFQCIQIVQFIYLVIRKHCQIIHISLSSHYGFYKSAAFILLAILLKKKKIIHLHSGDFKTFYQNHSGIMKWFIRYILQQGDYIIALSSYWKEVLINDFKILPEKVVVLNNCYDTQLNKLISINEKSLHKKRNNHMNLLFIGELNENKGIFDLIKISKELLRHRNDFILRIVGKEKLKGVKKQAQDEINASNMSDYVKLIGERRDKEKIKVFQQSDIFILPSYIENFPVTIVEAMRAGLPVLTTPVGSIPEIITNKENGYLIEPGDIHSFVKRILDLSKDSKLRQKMAQRNQEKALNQFNPIQYTKQLTKIYDCLLN